MRFVSVIFISVKTSHGKKFNIDGSLSLIKNEQTAFL